MYLMLEIIKTQYFGASLLNNKRLILAICASGVLVLGILLVPAFREIFKLAVLPKENILEVVALVLSPLVIVEILKLLKINTLKNEE